jgi:hypothetical protein
MNLEVVSAEHPRFINSQPSPHGDLKQKTAFCNDGCGDAGRNASKLLADNKFTQR